MSAMGGTSMKLIDKAQVRKMAIVHNGKKYIPYDKVMKLAEIPVDDLMSINWLQKQLVDMLYEQEIKTEVMKVFFELIERWKKR